MAKQHSTPSDRDRLMLQLFAEGMNTRNVAKWLDLKPHTVENRLTRVYRQMGVRDRTGAVVKAYREGLID